jgi:hypothetical protein
MKSHDLLLHQVGAVKMCLRGNIQWCELDLINPGGEKSGVGMHMSDVYLATTESTGVGSVAKLGRDLGNYWSTYFVLFLMKV